MWFGTLRFLSLRCRSRLYKYLHRANFGRDVGNEEAMTAGLMCGDWPSGRLHVRLDGAERPKHWCEWGGRDLSGRVEVDDEVDQEVATLESGAKTAAETEVRKADQSIDESLGDLESGAVKNVESILM